MQDAPLYLLVREKDWPDLAGTYPHLERLVTSAGKGPDKKHRLVLAALLSQQNNGQNDQMEQSAEQSEADDRPLPEFEQAQQLEQDGEISADDPDLTTSEDTDES